MRRFALITLFFCALLSCKEEAVTPTALPLASVSVENVFAIDMPIQLILPGTTSSVQDVEVEARVQGWLTQRHFQQGQEVVKGDLLYEIDATSFDLQRIQSIAVMESAAVQSDYAQKEYDRNEPLIKTGAVSMQTFDQLESQLEEALAQLAQAEAGVALAELNVSYCSIHAPISGIIGKTNVDVGTLVGPGTNSTLAEIVQISPMFVEFYPPANRLPQISTTIDSNEALSMQIVFTENLSEGQPSIGGSALTTNSVNGSLVFVDNTISSSTSTFLARGEFINERKNLPGTYAKVILQLSVVKGALMIPAKAVMQQSGGYFVWTVSSENKAEITPITLGAIQGDYQHILSGLNIGEAVIIEGASSLHSGTSVKITNPIEAK